MSDPVTAPRETGAEGREARTVLIQLFRAFETKRMPTTLPGCPGTLGYDDMADWFLSYQAAFLATPRPVEVTEGKLAAERAERVYFQSICYLAAACLERHLGRSVARGTGIVVGSAAKQSDDLLTALTAALRAQPAGGAPWAGSCPDCTFTPLGGGMSWRPCAKHEGVTFTAPIAGAGGTPCPLSTHGPFCEPSHTHPAPTLPPVGEREAVDVVAAIRRDAEGRYWLCKRNADGANADLAGMWEYPGGKVEAGEQLREALVREMCEEFGWGGSAEDVRIGAVLDSITYGKYRVTFFEVTMPEPNVLHSHTEVRWMTPDEACRVDHLPSGTIFNARHLATRPSPAPSGPEGYCAVCYHKLDACSHCDAPPAPSGERSDDISNIEEGALSAVRAKGFRVPNPLIVFEAVRFALASAPHPDGQGVGS